MNPKHFAETCRGIVVARRLALLPHRRKNEWVSVGSLWVLQLVQIHALSQVRLIGDMNVSLNGCQSLCVRLQQIGHLFRAYPGFRPMAAAIRSILDGWML